MTGGTLGGGMALSRAKHNATTSLVQGAMNRLTESEREKERQKELYRAKSEYRSPLVARINRQQEALKTADVTHAQR